MSLFLKYFLAMVMGVFAACYHQAVWASDVHVRGYYRGNGTYVMPHTRSAPDRSPYNNYGSWR